MQNKNYKNLMLHNFFGNFDTGVIFIFLSFLIWNKTETMLTVAIAFIIPVLINTVFDYLFSDLSDKTNRIHWLIIGNIGSAIFLSLYGVASSIYMLYFFIFMKSLFAKLYTSSYGPYIREAISEKDYKGFIAKQSVSISVGASIGGFTLMILYVNTENIPLVFLISGLVELLSTVFLFFLKPSNTTFHKENEDNIDLKWLKDITILYTIEALGVALIVNRIIIFLHDSHSVAIENVGIVFFIIYGISNILAAWIYRFFDKISIRYMLRLSYILQAIVLLMFVLMNNLILIIVAMFIYELINNITLIYTSDKINKSLYSNIGRKLSKFRITISLGGIVGQLIVGKIWDSYGVNASFYYSSFILLILVLFITINKDFTTST